MVTTLGPVWDGNEVWLLTAGGATFAAFPEWYATLFSGFYLPLLLILVALIMRGVAFEYRSKRSDPRWRKRWDAAIVVGSFVPALLWGVAFGNILRGVALGREPQRRLHLRRRSFFDLLNPYALLGGLTTLALFVTHGAIFLALKTDGAIRERANRIAGKVGLVAAVLAVVFLLWSQLAYSNAAWTWAPVVLAVARLRGRPGAPTGSAARGGPSCSARSRLGSAVIGLFGMLYPNVLPNIDRDLLGPHCAERRGVGVDAADHDRGGADPHARRARLPGVDLLGVPQAPVGHRHPEPRKRERWTTRTRPPAGWRAALRGSPRADPRPRPRPRGADPRGGGGWASSRGE